MAARGLWSRLVLGALLSAMALAAPACSRPGAKRDASGAADASGKGATPDKPRLPAQIRASVDRATATTGDVITYTVEIERAHDVTVTLAEPGASIAGLRIIDSGQEPLQRLAGKRTLERRWYQLRADLVGSYVLPAVSATYQVPAEGGSPATTPQELKTSEIFIEVKSVLPADGAARDIRDIKPLLPVGRSHTWAYVAGAGGVALAAAAAWLWWRRARGREKAAPPAPPAHEVAFAALDALRQSDFDDPAAVRQFHFAISEIVRAYLEARFALNASDLTSEEILAETPLLEQLGAQEKQLLRTFFGATDAVKFAALQPEADAIQETFESALIFVEKTQVRPLAGAAVPATALPTPAGSASAPP